MSSDRLVNCFRTDPFPVGLHVPILEAIYDRVPVISSFKLQECTNSHAVNVLMSIKDMTQGYEPRNGKPSAEVGVVDVTYDLYPHNAEDFGVLAVTLTRDAKRRQNYVVGQVELTK